MGGAIFNGTGDDLTGNTLNIMTTGLTVSIIDNFDTINFFLPAGLTKEATVVRALTEAWSDTATVNVGVEGSSSPLAKGDEVILIDAADLQGTIVNTKADGQGLQGISLKYEFDLVKTATQLKAIVTKADLSERLKAMTEGLIAGVALLAEGEGRPMEAPGQVRGIILGGLRGLLRRPVARRHRLPVDVSSFSRPPSAWAGASPWGPPAFGRSLPRVRRRLLRHLQLLPGPRTHGGRGPSQIRRGRGPGQDRQSEGWPPPFRDLRAIRLHQKRVRDRRSEIDDRDDGLIRVLVPLFRSHGGRRHLFGLAGSVSAEVFARHSFNRQKGQAVGLTTGETIVFQDADSSRVRLVGARLSRPIGDKAEVYAGAAWERELAGSARSSIFNLPIDPPSLRGDNGLGEAGLSVKPADAAAPPLSVDLGLQGQVGQRRGA
jgi:hypothetical protein